jgi:uncharacterized YccA/Bax inhibitor family protein
MSEPMTPAPQPRTSKDNRRRDSIMLSLSILIVLMIAFACILYALVIKNDLKPEIITLIGGFGGTILAMLGMVVSFEFGSSKGSQIKDQMLSAAPSPSSPPSTEISK